MLGNHEGDAGLVCTSYEDGGTSGDS